MLEGTKDSKNNAKLPLPLMYGGFEAGQSSEYIESLLDAETRKLAQCEINYYRGKGSECYELAQSLVGSKSGVIRISALLMSGFGALCMGETKKAFEVIKYMRDAYVEKSEQNFSYTEEEQQLMALISSISVVIMPSEWVKSYQLKLSQLPMGIRLMAIFASSYQEYLKGEYGVAVGIAKTALSIKDGSYPIGEIYLNLILASCYINLKDLKRAKEFFLRAWEIARPEGFVEPFAEFHGILGGMIEIQFKKDEPMAYEEIITQVYVIAQSWRGIRNSHSGATVTTELTTTEFTVAMLASKGWSNEQIAEHLNLSVSTVRTHLRKVSKKLGISSRKELSKFMLK